MMTPMVVVLRQDVMVVLPLAVLLAVIAVVPICLILLHLVKVDVKEHVQAVAKPDVLEIANMEVDKAFDYTD